jgi:hypothetical protein
MKVGEKYFRLIGQETQVIVEITKIENDIITYKHPEFINDFHVNNFKLVYPYKLEMDMV